MFLELQNRGCEAWYDMMTDDLTTGGMIAGIRESPVFLLFLTAGALERPFVQLELRTARREQREVLLVHEEDARLYAWHRALHRRADTAATPCAPQGI